MHFAMASEEVATPGALDRNVLTQHDRLWREALALQGRRESAIQREKDVIDRVSAAKARIGLKPQVEEVLEDLQRRAHERSVGAFERMLTGITDDVLPSYRGQRTVKLNLTTERNMPALDIFIDHQGNPEEITSGAVANVISTGLRFIALARSDARRFLVLDEADCFINEEAVPRFFNVIDQLARGAGIQALVITHHDLSDFSDEFRTYRVADVNGRDRWPARRLELVNPGNMTPSELLDNPLTFIRARQFEAYPEATLELSPGVTVISGANQKGKSSWARMLAAAFLADCPEGLIRHGQNTAEVAVGFADGRVLEYQRHRKGAAKGEFALHGPESWEHRLAEFPLRDMREGRIRALHHTVGARRPEWIPRETGMYEIDGINVQLWPQLDPVFMLNKSPSARASLLSIGRESGHLFAMSEAYKEDVRTDNAVVREGEREIAALRELIGSTSGLSLTLETLDRLRNEAGILLAEAETCRGIDALLGQLAVARTRLANWRGYLDKAGHWPTQMPVPEPTDDLRDCLDRLDQARRDAASKPQAVLPMSPQVEDTLDLETILVGLDRARLAQAVRQRLPVLPEVPSLEVTQPIEDWLSRWTQARAEAASRPRTPSPTPAPVEETTDLAALLAHVTQTRQLLQRHRQEQRSLENELATVEREVREATEALGNECPVCHGIVTAEMVLNHANGSHDHRPTPLASPCSAEAAVVTDDTLRDRALRASAVVDQSASLNPAPSGFRRSRNFAAPR